MKLFQLNEPEDETLATNSDDIQAIDNIINELDCFSRQFELSNKSTNRINSNDEESSHLLKDSILDDKNVVNLDSSNKNADIINLDDNFEPEKNLNIVTSTMDDNDDIEGKIIMDQLSKEKQPVPPPRLKKLLHSIKRTKNKLLTTTTENELATDDGTSSSTSESKMVTNINKNFEMKQLPDNANDNEENLDKINVNAKRDLLDNDEENNNNNNDGKIRPMLPINVDTTESNNNNTIVTTPLSDYSYSGSGSGSGCAISSPTSSSILSTPTSIGSSCLNSMENKNPLQPPIISGNNTSTSTSTSTSIISNINRQQYPSCDQFKHYRKHKIMDLRDDKPITGTGITSTIISEFCHIKSVHI